MKCSISHCPGKYENKKIAHTVRHHGRVVIIDGVPAEVCSTCGDVLLRPETVERIESLLREVREPGRTAPVYDYASTQHVGQKAFDLDAEVPRLGQRAELLASWYLRFNGYFPLTSFILQDAGAVKRPGGQITDADILAIRLPHTCEIIKGQRQDIVVETDPRLGVRQGMTDFVIAEVSSRECKFNWLDRDTGRVDAEFLEYCLKRFGYWPPKMLSKISKELSVDKYSFSDNAKQVRLRLLSFGARLSDGLPGIQQVSFETVLEYMKNLFGCYDPFGDESTRKVVSDHKQWHPLISEIYKRLRGHKAEEMSARDVLMWLLPDEG